MDLFSYRLRLESDEIIAGQAANRRAGRLDEKHRKSRQSPRPPVATGDRALPTTSATLDQLDYALAAEVSCVRICFIIFCIASMFPGERFSIHVS
jgi:hypothetical protein